MANEENEKNGDTRFRSAERRDATQPLCKGFAGISYSAHNNLLKMKQKRQLAN